MTETKIIHLLKDVYYKHLGNETPPIEYAFDFYECIYDDYPKYPKEKFGEIGKTCKAGPLIYPEYCKKFIEDEFGTLLEMLHKEREDKVPLTKAHIKFINDHIFTEKQCKRRCWPKSIYKACEIIYKELYEYIKEDGKFFSQDLTFEKFMENVNYLC